MASGDLMDVPCGILKGRSFIALLMICLFFGESVDAQKTEREICEEENCRDEFRKCKKNKVCSSFEVCQRACPGNAPDCLAGCVIRQGLIPSLRAIRLMGSLRSCAHRYCSHTFPDPEKCQGVEMKALQKTGHVCHDATDTVCPSASCAESIASNETRYAWLHCQHNRDFLEKNREEVAAIIEAIESCQKYISPGCKDVIGWKDPDNDDCQMYVNKGVCQDGELLVAEADLKRGCSGTKEGTIGECRDLTHKIFATEACCECGGGKSSDDCSTLQAKNCTKEYVEAGCGSLESISEECQSYTPCFQRECAMLPIQKHESMTGTLSCPGEKDVKAELVFYDVEPESISATLIFEETSSKASSGSLVPQTKSKNSCQELGWENAKLIGQFVKFKDTDGDTNTYVQDDKGLLSFVSKGEHGVKMKEGYVSQFKFDAKSSTLDDTYGVMRLPQDDDDDEAQKQTLSELADLAFLNNITGLELYHKPALSCMSGGKCPKTNNYRSAKGICETSGARLCRPWEIVKLTDVKSCPLQRGTLIWTGTQCQEEGMQQTIKMDIQMSSNGNFISKKEIEDNARTVCTSKDDKAYVMCCADASEASAGAVEALKGTYNSQGNSLTLHPIGWAYEASKKLGYSNSLATLDGFFNRKTQEYIGNHNLCQEGLGDFTFKVGEEQDGFAVLQKGLCACHNGGSPSSIDFVHDDEVDQITLQHCIKECESMNGKCRAIAYADDLCRLYVSSTDVINLDSPRYEKPIRHENDRCEIVKTMVDGTHSTATCYLRMGPKVHSPYRFYGASESTILQCADNFCHDKISACSWDDQCTHVLTCLALNATNSECVGKKCQEACIAESKAQLKLSQNSIETEDLLECIDENSCARVRGEETDDEDIDIMPHRLRVGYPMHLDDEVRKRIRNVTAFQKEVLGELASCLNVSQARLHYVKVEENGDNSVLLYVFEILDAKWDEVTESPEHLFHKLRWQAANKKSPIYRNQTRFKWLGKSSGSVFHVVHHSAEMSPYRTRQTDLPFDGIKDDTAGFLQGLFGALFGGLLVFLMLFIFIRFNRDSFLQHVLGLRIGRRSEGQGMEMERLAAEFDDRFPMRGNVISDPEERPGRKQNAKRRGTDSYQDLF